MIFSKFSAGRSSPVPIFLNDVPSGLRNNTAGDAFAHVVGFEKCAEFIYIYRDKSHFAPIFGSKVFEHRCKLSAGSAPYGVEVDYSQLLYLHTRCEGCGIFEFDYFAVLCYRGIKCHGGLLYGCLFCFGGPG